MDPFQIAIAILVWGSLLYTSIWKPASFQYNLVLDKYKWAKAWIHPDKSTPAWANILLSVVMVSLVGLLLIIVGLAMELCSIYFKWLGEALTLPVVWAFEEFWKLL